MKKKSISKVIALVMSVCCVLTAIPIVANAWPNDEWKKEASWNGDFEVGYEGMEVYGWKLVPFTNSLTLGTDTSYATKNHTLKTAVENGNKVAQLNRVGGGYAAMASQAIAVTGGQGYQISLDYKTIEVTAVGTNNQAFSGINLVVQQFNQNGEETWQHWTIDEKGYGQTVSSEWSSLNQILMMESDTVSAVVYIAIRGEWNSRAKVLLDNVKVQECDTNNVLNGDFETSQDAEGIDGWKLLPCSSGGSGNTGTASHPNNYVISKVTENDNSYMKLAPKNTTNGYVVAQSSYVPIQPNQTYTLSYDLKADGSDKENTNNDLRPKVCIYYYDINKTYLSVTKATHTYEELVTWTSFGYEYTAPENAAYITVNYYIGGFSTTGATPEHYIDNVNIVKDDCTQIFNGDFEVDQNGAGAYGWKLVAANSAGGGNGSISATHSNNYVISKEMEEDNSYMKLAPKNTTNGYVVAQSSYVPIQPNQTYTLSYDLKADGSDKENTNNDLRPKVCIYYYDINKTYLSVTKATHTYEELVTWKSFSHEYTAPENAAYITVNYYIGGFSNTGATPEHYIDNVEIKSYEKPEWTEESTNYEGTGVPNNPEDDFRENYDIVYTTKDNREGVLKLYVTKEEGCLGAVTYFSEKIPVTGNTTYMTSYDLKIEGRDDNTTLPGAVYVIRYLDSNGEVCGTERINTSSTSPISNQDWTTYSKQITTPESAVSAQIGLLIGSVTKNISKNMAYYYDNLLLEKSEILEKGANYLLFEGGDIDGNTGVDVRDLAQWKEFEANKESVEFKKDADMNKNEKYDSDDQTLLMWKLLGKY